MLSQNDESKPQATLLRSGFRLEGRYYHRHGPGDLRTLGNFYWILIGSYVTSFHAKSITWIHDLLCIAWLFSSHTANQCRLGLKVSK